MSGYSKPDVIQDKWKDDGKSKFKIEWKLDSSPKDESASNSKPESITGSRNTAQTNKIEIEKTVKTQTKKPVVSSEEGDIIDLFDSKPIVSNNIETNKIEKKSESGDIDSFFNNINIVDNRSHNQDMLATSVTKDGVDLFNYTGKGSDSTNISNAFVEKSS
jgi:hypothetical protein